MLDELPTTFVTIEALFAVVNATIFNSLGRRTSWTDWHWQQESTQVAILTSLLLEHYPNQYALYYIGACFSSTTDLLRIAAFKASASRYLFSLNFRF